MSEWNDALDAAASAVLQCTGWNHQGEVVVDRGVARTAILLLRRHEDPQPEKRCGTCANLDREYGDDDRYYCEPSETFNTDNGPPWENCRFWRKR